MKGLLVLFLASFLMSFSCVLGIGISQKEQIKKKTTCIIVLTDPSFCRPCRLFESDLKQNAVLKRWWSENVLFDWRVYYNRDEDSKRIFAAYKVKKIPTFIIGHYEDGKWVVDKQFLNYTNPDEFIKKVEE